MIRQTLVVAGLWLMVAFSDGWAVTPLWQRAIIGVGFVALFLRDLWPRTQAERENRPPKSENHTP